MWFVPACETTVITMEIFFGFGGQKGFSFGLTKQLNKLNK